MCHPDRSDQGEVERCFERTRRWKAETRLTLLAMVLVCLFLENVARVDDSNKNGGEIIMCRSKKGLGRRSLFSVMLVCKIPMNFDRFNCFYSCR